MIVPAIAARHSSPWVFMDVHGLVVRRAWSAARWRRHSGSPCWPYSPPRNPLWLLGTPSRTLRSPGQQTSHRVLRPAVRIPRRRRVQSGPSAASASTSGARSWRSHNDDPPGSTYLHSAARSQRSTSDDLARPGGLSGTFLIRPHRNRRVRRVPFRRPIPYGDGRAFNVVVRARVAAPEAVRCAGRVVAVQAVAVIPLNGPRV